MNSHYDNLSKEQLIAENQRLRGELLIARSECKQIDIRMREIKSERRGYLWRRSDERLVTLNRKNRELKELIDKIRSYQEEINEELNYIKVANNGGSERHVNYYDTFDDKLYLSELAKNGYINGFKF